MGKTRITAIVVGLLITVLFGVAAVSNDNNPYRCQGYPASVGVPQQFGALVGLVHLRIMRADFPSDPQFDLWANLRPEEKPAASQFADVWSLAELRYRRKELEVRRRLLCEFQTGPVRSRDFFLISLGALQFVVLLTVAPWMWLQRRRFLVAIVGKSLQVSDRSRNWWRSVIREARKN